MAELVLYISASAELDAECELVGQLLAHVPRSARWVIKRTPRSFEYGNPDLDVLRRSHFYLILMAMDITAPIGVEYQAAREAGLSILAYRNSSAVPSPAATVFVREVDLPWQLYQTPQQFIHLLERDLIRRLVQGTPGYGLDLTDLEELAARLRALEESKPEGGEERRGAGRGGVILPSHAGAVS